MGSDRIKFDDLDETMDEFALAVAAHRDTDITDAQYMLEALHGQNAPIMAIALACTALREETEEHTRFWMKVYAALLAPRAPQGVRLH